MKKYQMLMNVCTDSAEKMTASQMERIFEMAENEGCKLESVRKWLHTQPLKEYTKNRIDDIYTMFTE
jgi:hypothetical protein